MSTRLVLIALLATLVTGLMVATDRMTLLPRASTDRMIDGTADRPFVYRVLLPTTVRALRAVTPDRVADATEIEALRSLRERMRMPNGRSYEALWTVLLMWASLVGYGLLMLRLGRHFFLDEHAASAAAGIVGLLALPSFFTVVYVYDFTVLFLSAWCLLCLAERRWYAYLAVFSLACLNKETAVVLLVVFVACYRDRLPRRQLMALGFGQLAVFGTVKGMLTLVYRSNPGAVIEQHFLRQLVRLDEYSWWTLLVVAGGVGAMAFRWSDKPLFLRRAIWATLPLVILYLLGGSPGELRVFYDIFPIATLLAVAPLASPAWVDPVGAR